MNKTLNTRSKAYREAKQAYHVAFLAYRNDASAARPDYDAFGVLAHHAADIRYQIDRALQARAVSTPPLAAKTAGRPLAKGLTTLEAQVLEALRDNAQACSGGDFACLEEVNVEGLTRQQLGGVVTSLENKRVISVDITYVNDREKVTQVTFND